MIRKPKILTLDGFKHLKWNKINSQKYLAIGLCLSEIYIDEDERVHRDNDKAAIYEYKILKNKLSLISKKWYKHGLNHRDNGPAVIRYDRAGRIRSKQYKTNGLMNKIDGPAYINYDKKGNITTGHFIINDSLYNARVMEWISKNGYNSWRNMNSEDFNRMWMEIL